MMFNASQRVTTHFARRIITRGTGSHVVNGNVSSLISTSSSIASRNNIILSTSSYSYSSSTPFFSSNDDNIDGRGPLAAFRDPVDRQTRMSEPVGRSWSVKELRRKSYDDLWRLWYVLYKERNMLLTERQLSRRRLLRFPQPERFRKVQKSMQAIKQVLGERKRQKIAEFKERKQQEMEDETDRIAEMDLSDMGEEEEEEEKKVK